MKNLILLTLSIFFLFSCSKSEPETLIDGGWSVDGRNFQIQKDFCDIGGWQGTIQRNDVSVDYLTKIKLDNSEGQSLEMEIHFIEMDTSFIFFTEEKAMQLLSPREIDMSNFPNFYIRVVCEFDGKSYSNVVYDFQDIIVSDDFKLSIENLDLEFSHDCIDGARNLILKGNFSGTLTNQFDKSEKIFVDNGDFNYLFFRY